MGDQQQVKIFAERLNEAIESNGISARELSSICNISEANISRYRKGYAIPARGNIFALSNALHVSTRWLLGHTENKNYDLTPEEKARNRIDSLLERMNLTQLEDTELLINKFIMK